MQNLTTNKSRQDGWEDERKFMSVTPYLKLLVFLVGSRYCQFSNVLYWYPHEEDVQKQCWCAYTFFLKTSLFLSVYICFFFSKEVTIDEK